MAARVVEVELTERPGSIPVDPHTAAFVLVRVHGHPVGAVRVACEDGVLTPARLADAVAADRGLSDRIARRLVLDELVPAAATAKTTTTLPTWSVAVCTRDRPRQLERCVKSLLDLEPAPTQVLVVDNGSSTPETADVARRLGVEYVEEPRPGLNRARRRALSVATGEVVLFTDDDVAVDPGWGGAMVEPFGDPRVAAVTGLVMPMELETDAQELFEAESGFSRGFERKEHDASSLPPVRAGSMGAGASLGVRRSIAVDLDVFDAPLDGGTPARSGGDTYALYLVLHRGWKVVYTPDALAWHEHRRDRGAVIATLAGYSTGAFAWMIRALVVHRDLSAARAMLQWFRSYHLHRLRRSIRRRRGAPDLDIVLAELRGALAAPRAFLRSR